MKKIFSIIALFTVALTINAQWINDYSTAQQKANDENKVLMIVFSGSDWCKPCIKLKKEILTTPEFTSFASKHLVIYNADFPFKIKQTKTLKKENESLAEKYNSKGIFPHIVFLKNNEVIYNCGYKDIAPEEYIATVQKELAEHNCLLTQK